MHSRKPSRNARTALGLVAVVAAMVGLSFASVPLYRLFCQVTGLGGTTQVAQSAPGAAEGRVIDVRFNADVDPRLPWTFVPMQREVSVRVGEPELIFYRARNPAARPVSGTATFNVTPLKAGQYFVKVQCFCFTEQRLEPGEEVEMGVSFFIDPAILEDRNADDVKTITLSYTFFPQPDADEEEAPERPEQVTRSAAPAGGRAPSGVN